MKHALMPQKPTWWVWLATIALLAIGLAGFPTGFIAAIALSFAQAWFFWRKAGDVRAISVQIRLSYALLLTVCFIPQMRWLYWLPAVGTSALLVFGYCLMARTLSLLPWNCTERLSSDLLRRTFFSAPAATHEGVRSACGGLNGVCELESRIASLQLEARRSNLPLNNQPGFTR
jgi:hypothetical protein